MPQSPGTLRPWPANGVIAECPEGEGVAVADLHLDEPHANRRDGAATTHADRRRRSDLHARWMALEAEALHAR